MYSNWRPIANAPEVPFQLERLETTMVRDAVIDPADIGTYAQEDENDKEEWDCVDTKIVCPGCQNLTLYGAVPGNLISEEDPLYVYECRCQRVYAVCIRCNAPPPPNQSATVRLAALLTHDERNAPGGDGYVVQSKGYLGEDEDEDDFTEVVYTRPTWHYDQRIFGDFIGDCGNSRSMWMCDCGAWDVDK